MNKVETLQEIIKQGDCFGIFCSDCYFFGFGMDGCQANIDYRSKNNTETDWGNNKVELSKRALNKIREDKLKRIINER
jgi:hypothetical protein